MDRTIFHVFLSHNSADKPAVEALAVRLRKEGIEPWLDKWNLIPGEAWQPAIEKALDDCATCAVFIGPSGMGPWQNEEMRAAIDRRVSQKKGFRVIPVLLPGGQREERSRLPTFLVVTTWVEFRRTLDEEDAFHRLLCGIRGIAPGPGPGQAVFEGVCPYRGLQVFRTEDAPFFFGREALTEWLLTMLRPAPDSGWENRFLAIIGASGSGKSSLARAGLIPALQRGELEGSEQWPVVICKPGPNPLESLAVALVADVAVGKGIGVADLINHLRDDPHTLHLTVRVALHGGPETRRVVVLVDQFEEIFTLCHDDTLQQALIDNLCHASSVMLGQTVVVLTLRADFYGKCSAYPTLAAALSDHQMLVGPMTEDELQRAIESPAQLAGGELEHGLTEMLLQDVKNQAGALPLLEHALLELWEHREGRRLTVAAYREIGELEGALEQHANTVYKSLSATEQDICQRILLRLTQPGEGTEDTKRRALRKELGESDSVDTVIQKLANARLITTEGEESQAAEADGQRRHEAYVEVSHEALIRGWPMLRGWIDADRESLRIQHRLSNAAREWDAQHQDEAYLYRGLLLEEAEKHAQAHGANLNVLEQEFLKASKTLRTKEKRKEQRSASLLDLAQVMIVNHDHQGRILMVNAYTQTVTGYRQEELVGRDFFTALFAEGTADRHRIREELASDPHKHLRHESLITCKNGSIRNITWFHSRLTADAPEDPEVLSVGLDITERLGAESRFAWLSDHDTLTGLLNRRRFQEELELVLTAARRHNKTGALLFIDLDNFKYINDTRGHHTGDALLKAVGKVLSNNIEAADVVARLDGDEFAILVRDTDPKGAVLAAADIQQALHNLSFMGGTQALRISASIGIVLFPLHADTVGDLMASADLAMFQAKEEGRGHWHLFSKDDATRERLRNRFYWQDKVSKALAEDRFLLYFQPIIEIRNRRVSHYEVLLRMRDDDGAIISSAHFVDAAERGGMINALDRMVVSKAVRFLAELRQYGHHVAFAINLSGYAFNNPQLLPHLQQELQRHQVDTSKVIFEITETAAVSDFAVANSVMLAIEELGCRFALDHFGIGFSSFYYLKHLPVDYLKIDGSFIRQLADSLDDQIIVQAMSQVAVQFGKKTIAEFVETEAVLDKLRDCHIDYAQGYLISKPVSADQLMASLVRKGSEGEITRWANVY
jgi:diguanylate cyclase (GGDEF)-like protein/PAS domain S-box-containing protein